MTEKELANYRQLNDIFVSECERVANILKDEPGSDTAFAEEFRIEGEDVCWEGDEYWNYGGHEHYSDSFPAEYLTMPEDQLKEIVRKKIEEHEAKVQAKKEAERAKATEERRKKYEELKKEFGE